MKGISKPWAPKSGPGYSAGKKPPAVSTSGHTAHPKASSGNARVKAADPKGAAPMSGSPKAGNHAIMRKAY